MRRARRETPRTTARKSPANSPKYRTNERKNHHMNQVKCASAARAPRSVLLAGFTLPWMVAVINSRLVCRVFDIQSNEECMFKRVHHMRSCRVNVEPRQVGNPLKVSVVNLWMWVLRPLNQCYGDLPPALAIRSGTGNPLSVRFGRRRRYFDAVARGK